jgi:mediator of RNA polymerase II transcription subunit 12
MAPQSESGRNSVPGGSPLDILPLQPSIFPMPTRANNALIRAQLVDSEDQVIARSKAVEAKWSCDEWQQSSAASILNKVLPSLDALDKHNFDKIDSSNSLDTLYSQIFTNPPDNSNPVDVDAPIVLLLCKWAVGCQRTGEHRSLVVGRLLEHRQSDILSTSSSASAIGGSTEDNNKDNKDQQQQSNSDNNNVVNIKSEILDDDVPMLEPENVDGNTTLNSSNNKIIVNGLSSKDNNNKDSNKDQQDSQNEEVFPNGLPIFHNLLLGFLDTDAPIYGMTIDKYIILHSCIRSYN